MKAYLAPVGYEKQLLGEIEPTASYGRLYVTEKEPRHPVLWAQNIWHNPFIAPFDSISEAAHLLKGLQRNWVHYPHVEHRRGALIQEKLPYLSLKALKFPTQLPRQPLGSWTLLDKNTLLAAAHCSSPYPHGQMLFEECPHGPPSRAYLKLWEALTLLGTRPGPTSKCLEIGASPGGWTWVLAKLGAQVLAVDRSPLDPLVAAMPGIRFQAGNAFACLPEKIGPVDWIFSDVACYPEKLLEWVHLWLQSGHSPHFVCTLKFQGTPSYAIAQEFLKIPGSQVLHLGYNKHELTWMRLP